MSIALPGQIPLMWFKADDITLVGNLVRVWPDNGQLGFDHEPLDSSNSLRPTVNWPALDTNVFASGLPGVNFAGALAKILQNNQNPFTSPDLPVPPGSSRTILTLCKPNSNIGGRIMCFRRTAPGWLIEVQRSIFAQTHFASDFAFNTLILGSEVPLPNGTAAPALDYTNTAVVISWEFDAAGNCAVKANGALLATYDYNGTAFNRTFVPDNGWAGSTIGYSDIDVGASFAGWIGELLVYPGVDASVTIPATTYLLQRGGLIGNSHPPLGGMAPTGHMFRYAPKAFGDQFYNPGQAVTS